MGSERSRKSAKWSQKVFKRESERVQKGVRKCSKEGQKEFKMGSERVQRVKKTGKR